jgi:DNA-binding transcriptional MerR regulator
MKNGTISAKEIVRRFNISYHTVNYYTAIGLLPVLKKQGNQRVYDEKEVKRRLSIIFDLIKEGYPLQLIRKKIA